MTDDKRVLLAVGAGAAVGSLARFGVVLASVHLLGPAFPWGTLLVNTLGSFLIAVYAVRVHQDRSGAVSAARRHGVMAGFCGGFTTFSIFSLEVLVLVQAGALGWAAGYALLSPVLWLAAAWLGMRLARGEP
jgi:fluoride exporter